VKGVDPVAHVAQAHAVVDAAERGINEELWRSLSPLHAPAG
jgi:hypothetical protein